MPDYNLGRAHGEINITADTRGAQEAQAAMAAAAAEAELLDRQMGHVNRSFDENRRGGAASAEQIVKFRGEVEQLRVAYKRYQEDYERASNRTREAQERANQALRAGVDDIQELISLERDIDRAREEERKALRLASDAYDSYRNRVIAVKQEIDQFNRVHQEATQGLRRMRREVEQLGESLERMSAMLGSVARIVGTGGLMGMLGLASGGQLFASGAAGLNGLMSMLGGALEIIKDLSGALLLLPGVINAGVISLATLAVAFHGVGEAIGAIGDPAKFIEAIKDMGPVTQQAMLQIQQFANAFRGAREVVQESFFAQIVNDIKPLVMTWLPLLMNAGKEIAGQFGGALHDVFMVFQRPEMQSGFSQFIQNFSRGLQAARGAIAPFLEAWNTLALIGSQAFERLGIALTTVMEKFNAWVQRNAESGQLYAWIDRALTGFTNMAHVVGNIAIAINNVFNAARGDRGGAIENLLELTQKFRDWTESVSGQNALVNFFELLHAAVTVVRPEMKLLGDALAIVGGTLTRLGIALGPGITAFFTSFRDALASLAPNVLAIAPALNEFLTVLGDTLLEIVQQLGPQLPVLFQGLADAFIAIAPILPAVASGIASIMEHLSPGDIQGIFLAVLALKGLSTVFSGLLGVMSISPIMLVIGALTLLGVGAVLAYNRFEGFRKFINDLWPALQAFGSWLKTGFVNAWNSVSSAVQRAYQGAKNWAGELASTIRDTISGIGGYFASIWDQAYEWGHSLIGKIVQGMRDKLGEVGDIANDVANAISDFIKTGSPARRGPLAEMAPEDMGAKIAGDFAQGLASGSSGVGAASSSLAAGVTGGGTGGLSLGNPGGTGNQGFESGTSGFDQAVTFLTRDLAAWSEIAQGAFGLFKDISDIFVDVVKVTASIWGGGDNPLTRPGGIAGPPQAAPQATVPGVPNKPIPGKAPIPELAPLGGGPSTASQTEVPGVPSKGPAGTGAPVQGPPVPAAAPAAASPPAAGDSDLAAALKRRGISDEQIRLIEGFSQVEGNNPAGNPTLGFTDAQLGGDTSLEGHVDALINQMQSRQGATTARGTKIGAFPAGGSDQDKAQWIADVVGQAGVASDWQGNAQPQDYVQRVIGAMPAGRGGGGAPLTRMANGQIDARQLPEGMAPARGLYPNTELANRAVSAIFGERIRAAGGVIGGNRANDSGSGEHQGGALDIGIVPIGTQPTPEQTQLGREIQSFLQQNAEAFGLQWTIFDQQITSAGGNPRNYTGGSGVTGGHFDHVHAFFGGDVPSGSYPRDNAQGIFNPPAGWTDPNSNPNNISNAFGQLGDRPRGDGSFGSFAIPGDASTFGIAATATLGGGAALIAFSKLRRFGSAARLKWLQFNFNRLDAKSRADVLKDLSPEERAFAGRNPTVTFGNAGAETPEVKGMVADISGDQAPTDRLGGMNAEQKAWMDEFSRRPVVPGAELGNMTPAEMQYASRLLSGEDPGKPPPRPSTIFNEAGERVPYNTANLRPPQTGFSSGPTTIDLDPNQFYRPGQPATVTGDVGRAPIPPVEQGPIGMGTRLFRGAGTAVDAFGIPLAIHATGEVVQGRRAGPLTGAAAVAAPTVIGGGFLAAGSAAGVALTPAVIGAGALMGVATATGAATGGGQDVEAENTGLPMYGAPNTSAGSGWVYNARGILVPGHIENRTVTTTTPATTTGSAAPTGSFIGGAAQQRQPRLGGLPGAQAERRGRTGTGGSLFGDAAAGSQPVHVTNPQQLPGGTQAPVTTTKVVPTAVETGPKPGEPGFIGPVARPQDQGPRPGAQAERRGAPEVPHGVGTALGAQPGPPTGTVGDLQKPESDTRSPIDKFSDTMASVSSIAGDAFQVFNDIIENIGATANITDKLVRGVANTEDIFGQGGLIDQFQTFIKTAADIAKLVGDVGGLIGGAGKGDPSGMAGAIGGGIQAIAGIVQAALEATNAAIDLGQQVYHEVTKYAGFIIGGFLGGPNTGPLGGNVRMLLNTSTNQLYTYSEDNPLNKNTFNVPGWQQSYTQTPPPMTVQSQVNLYAGPGQTPRDMMNETMWMVGTGSPLVASVSGSD